MQRHVCVTCRHQVAHLFARPIAGEYGHRMCAGRRLHLRKRFWIQVLVDTFDDQVYVVVARKRLRKGSNGRERVLSLDVAGEIEDEQEHKGIRTGGIRTTGTGETAARALAMKELAAQISS